MVRTRFAPSPTGYLHIGGVRTALFCWLFARRGGGQFILRIDDTDQERNVDEALAPILRGLRWMGIEWDEGPDVGGTYGPYRQSERKELYQEFAQRLLQSGNAYYCFCSPDRLERMRQEQQKRKEPPHYDGTCRLLSLEDAESRVRAGEPHVIRFKTPKEGTTTVRDVLRGDITVENRTIDDYILVKTDGFAVYHLAAMVDDYSMKITHVIRGSEWLPTLPLHAMICRALGREEPKWVHLSVFLKPSGKGKMSKREAAELLKDDHSIFLKDLEGLGYLPEAVVNWIALMGWSYDDHTEFFTLDDLVHKFSLTKLNPSPAAINFTKFDYFNGLHIRELSDLDFAQRIQPFFTAAGLEADLDTLLKIAPIIKERVATIDDAVEMAGFFFRSQVVPKAEDLIAKGLSADKSALVARRVLEIMEPLPNLALETTEPLLRQLVEESGLSAGQVFGIIRAAVTGQKISPPLFESIAIIDREIVIERLKNAVRLLEQLG
jgi:glutamyl-tRNA synthetase